jgi:EPS-associated MarR family transcriptional regulator
MSNKKLISSRQAAIQEDIHFQVLRLLLTHPDMSQRNLAAKVGISLGSLNYCLRALMDKGFVKLGNFQSSKHKFKYVYILTPAGIAQKIVLTGRFLQRKIGEYEALKTEIESLKADLSAIQVGARETLESAK